MKAVALTLSLLLLGACAAQPVIPSHYLLRTSATLEARALHFTEAYALGNVTIAPYLDQPGLILETNEGTLRAARGHLWAEPLFEAVPHFLRQAISDALGADLPPASLRPESVQINIRLDQMHGTQDGQAILVADWWLNDGAGAANAFRFSQVEPLAKDGYAALAEAQAALLSRLARQIARQLQDANPPPGT